MYNLYTYIIKVALLHLLTYRWKYINIVSSSNSFLSEFQKMKGCLNRVKNANNAIRLHWFWHHPIVLLVKKLDFLRESAKYNLWRDFAIIVQCSLCICRVAYSQYQKCHCQQLEHIQMEMNQRTDASISGDGWILAGEKRDPFDILSNNTKFVNCNLK